MTPYYQHAGTKLYRGDCLAVLESIESESVHCAISSPPYWALRDYELPATDWPEVTFAPIAGLPTTTVPAQATQLGHETDPWHFVGHVVHVLRVLRRVLRRDGTLWLNMGDSYASGGRGGGGRTWMSAAMRAGRPRAA